MSIFKAPLPHVSLTPAPRRQTGWYWVKPDNRSSEWTPAKYISEVGCWYSITFGGLRDSYMLEIGEAIVRA